MPARSLLVLFLSGALVAQSVSPLHFAVAEGNASNAFPFGSTPVPFRYSQVHDDVPAMVILGMSFRHNATATVYPVHSVTMDAWVSTAVTTAATMSTTFANNHGLDKIQVVTNRTYTHPVSNPFDLPGPFVLDYPFDVPFGFGGGGASLCWEVHVTAKTQTGSIIYDSVTSTATTAINPTNPAMAAVRVGDGCIATGRTVAMLANPGSSMNWAAPTAMMVVLGTHLQVNGIVFFTIGMDNTNWNGTPLPVVIPTSTGAPSGPCTVYADILASTLAIANSTGSASITYTFPALPGFHGLTFSSQIWGLDLAANPFGVTTSNLAMHNILAPYTMPLPVNRVYLAASLGAVGTLGLRDGLVTRFY